ncbi:MULTISPECIES: phosphoadenosine phosphosulfate reductase domain-containing protein [Xanthomonas]|uniref:Phosphoadenosine phosphosulfate reductase n=5 Tax=Xanthomonas TaxID=338 RepID=A0A6V7FI08_9XANT|nr:MULTISPECIES: phosphoadenosine phosphosulfate reductase family protein [Xanthomonas]MEB1846188.1 phosphoadenosine phosphosulfate reductase family protein [Xanthomonas campestris pv. campestris]APP78124.1 phosphoadenosine phosphosulfate reductase [Xanthomonas vesicatoria ATCC 35937]APP87309.1 phosphoadenosine phosphosulfate reductase [Xanthomonas hortorum pv. gardneri]APR13229.1 phosphoadenosine phosphosulfate reductase [Xanthomonas citri pv. citri]APR17930.1 phosphoadenosine phosphosulfate 
MDELPTIQQLIERNALFVVSHSGGKDSQAMLIKLIDRIPPAQLLVIHASLGESEWHGALELAKEQAEVAGLPFLVARAPKTFLQMVERRYEVRPGPNSSCWPGAKSRQCTSDLKRGPIEREVRRYAKDKLFSTVVSCMGMRAAESPARAKRIALTINKRGTVRGRDWFEWLPIHDMTTAEVWRTIAAAGQVPHPAYLSGSSRLSCVFCFFAGARDIANGARYRPELYKQYRDIEQRTGYTLHQSRRPLDEMVRLGNEQLESLVSYPNPVDDDGQPLWLGGVFAVGRPPLLPA